MADQFKPGDILCGIVIAYRGEDDEGIDVDAMMRVNPGCDPVSYSHVFIETLERVVADMKEKRARLIVARNAESN